MNFCCASEDVVAHPSNVSSLVLGKSSSRLLATGGEDCKVNIWAVNKPNCIMVVIHSAQLGQGIESTTAKGRGFVNFEVFFCLL